MQGLVPGDLNAVDWAQEAHENLLASRGTYAAAPLYPNLERGLLS